ncbi:uncharacterized protein METZ01_LOCUS35812 [marine metagenome]|uniref:Uncharacterized protein n=1 Tax=marine metagenome TaxID=408172 RepID=A0A381QWI7_9ZZZZ
MWFNYYFLLDLTTVCYIISQCVKHYIEAEHCNEIILVFNLELS